MIVGAAVLVGGTKVGLIGFGFWVDEDELVVKEVVMRRLLDNGGVAPGVGPGLVKVPEGALRPAARHCAAISG